MTALWIGFFAFVVAMLALDLGVLQRRAHAPTITQALRWTGAWVALGLSFSIVVYGVYEYGWFGASLHEGHAPEDNGGTGAVIRYLTAYILEESLSVDNIFVIALLFHAFRVPAQYQHRILYWGILGAIVFRAVMIGGGIWFVSHFTWAFYIFGGYLAWSGIKFFREGSGEDAAAAPRESWIVRLAKRWLPITTTDHGGKFLARENGKRVFTQLFLALIAVETTDVVFALDSIPAVLAVSSEPFIIITSNVFAILGLRSLYFVLADMMNRFRYLKPALAFLLIFIGAKMMLHDVWHVPNLLSLVAVLVIVSSGVAASLWRAPRTEERDAK